MTADKAIHELTRLDVIARIGMAARGTVYVIIGYLVFNAGRHAHEGQTGAFAALAEVPLGWILLIVVTAGLFAYAVYRLATALFDTDRNGSDLTGIANRIGHAGVAATYFVFSYLAAEIALGLRNVRREDGNVTSRLLAERLLDLPLGPILLGLVGTGFLVSMALNIKNAIKGNHMKFCAANAPRFVTFTGRLGMFTQAAIAGMIGWSMLRAAWFESSGQALGMGGAIEGIRSQALLYNAIAIGLMLFGVFSLMQARWRIVPKIDVVEEVKDKAEVAKEKIEEVRAEVKAG